MNRADYTESVEFTVGPAWGEWAGYSIDHIEALVLKPAPRPRRKIYCADLKVLPLPQIRSAFPDLLSAVDVCVRPWIAELDLEPGIYGLAGDFLVVGPRVIRKSAEPRPVRAGRGLTKLLFSKPNRSARRDKGRIGRADFDL